MTLHTGHVVIAAERTPMWREFTHKLLADGIEYAWVPADTLPGDIPGDLPPSPTLVIVDFAADPARGIAIVNACRQERHPVPVVVVATNPPVDLVRELRLAGVFYLALHPVTTDEMQAVVRNAFECLSRQQHETSHCRAPRRILIVDDDADYVRSMTTLLESRGYVVSSARSGREGLEKLRADPPDLIILDVMMEHESSGYEVNQTVKFAASFDAVHHIPIVMVSSIPLDPPTRFHMAGEVEEITPNRYMTKPIDIPRLLANVRELLGETEPVSA